MIDLRVCEYFFLPLNPNCTTTSTTITTTTTLLPITTSTTTIIPVTTTTTTTLACQCYEGYEITPDGQNCVKTETTIATPPTNLQVSVAKTYYLYSVYGSILFNLGYNLNGTTSAGYQILSTSLWKNIPNVATEGPLNRCGLWTPIATSDQDVGFTHCIDLTSTKTYYIAVACDNYAIIRVDGTTIVSQDVTALTAQFGAGPSVTFKYWFIYPVELSVGSHVIEMIGHNVSSIAAMGAEIYDATPTELIDATDYTTFYNDHILFTTKDMIGQSIQIGNEGYGYTCPNGFSLITCDGPPYCINTKYLACGENLCSIPTITDIQSEYLPFSAMVNPHGLETIVTLEYGLVSDEEYTYTRECLESPITGDIEVFVSSFLGTVQEGEIYNWRLVATNSCGVAYSENYVFAVPIK